MTFNSDADYFYDIAPTGPSTWGKAQRTQECTSYPFAYPSNQQ